MKMVKGLRRPSKIFIGSKDSRYTFMISVVPKIIIRYSQVATRLQRSSQQDSTTNFDRLQLQIIKL